MKELSDFFKALSDPTRRKILDLLREGDKTPSELLAVMEISQPTLSHHLDILKRSNLIEGEREGQFIRYSLNMGISEMAVEYILKLVKKRSTDELENKK
jgi:ArsR family transcriptional regulator